MSAAESEESRWPDLATASIRTQSIRSTVAQRSSSANEGCAATRSASFGGGLGSGTGFRCVTPARLAAEAIPQASVWVRWDGTGAVFFRNERARMQSCGCSSALLSLGAGSALPPGDLSAGALLAITDR